MMGKILLAFCMVAAVVYLGLELTVDTDSNEICVSKGFDGAETAADGKIFCVRTTLSNTTEGDYGTKTSQLNGTEV